MFEYLAGDTITGISATNEANPLAKVPVWTEIYGTWKRAQAAHAALLRGGAYLAGFYWPEINTGRPAGESICLNDVAIFWLLVEFGRVYCGNYCILGRSISSDVTLSIYYSLYHK